MIAVSDDNDLYLANGEVYEFESDNSCGDPECCGPKTWSMASKDWPLMQFTGLRDKNGVEIYEGDVVKRWAERLDMGTSEVKFGKALAGESADMTQVFNGWYLEEDCVPLTNEYYSLEVIGNIWEHGFLLENKKPKK